MWARILAVCWNLMHLLTRLEKCSFAQLDSCHFFLTVIHNKTLHKASWNLTSLMFIVSHSMLNQGVKWTSFITLSNYLAAMIHPNKHFEKTTSEIFDISQYIKLISARASQYSADQRSNAVIKFTPISSIHDYDLFRPWTSKYRYFKTTRGITAVIFHHLILQAWPWNNLRNTSSIVTLYRISWSEIQQKRKWKEFIELQQCTELDEVIFLVGLPH